MLGAQIFRDLRLVKDWMTELCIFLSQLTWGFMVIESGRGSYRKIWWKCERRLKNYLRSILEDFRRAGLVVRTGK